MADQAISKAEIAAAKVDVTKALASFPWAEWRQTLHDLYAPLYREIVELQAARVLKPEPKKAAGDGFDWSKPAKRFTDAYIGERVTQISDTTREWVKTAVIDELESAEGLSIRDLAETLADAAENSRAFDQARALTIARTEVAIAYNHGSVLGYRQDGVESVLVSDGDGDGPCAEADGEVWTLDEALDNPLEHPNCERSFAPIYPGDDAEESE
jgi:hypothetical protein